MKVVYTAAAGLAGLLVLLGYFLPIPALMAVRETLISWAVILAGVAALVGVFYLFRVHWRKVAAAGKSRDYYSIVLLVAFLATLAAGFYLKPDSPEFQQLVLSVQKPIETSLLALVALSLAYFSLRLLAHRRGFMPAAFFISAVVFLALSSGLGGILALIPAASPVVDFIQVLPLAGARGILLGIALGSLLTGVRILMGLDRPYSG